jgi:hypothetical protein
VGGLTFRREYALVIGFILVATMTHSGQVDGAYISLAEEHAPIQIVGNEDFIAQASMEGWSGTGSEESPIVIKGLSITSESYGISISDVDVHFRIEECTITSSETVYWCFGILIENCSNVAIENCIIWGHEFGILLSHSDGAYVYRTEVFESFFGVFVNESSGVWLHSLDIILCKVGVRLNHTLFAYVDQTIIEFPEYSGFECFGDNGTELRHNTVLGSEKGVQFVLSGNWVVEESYVGSCESGIEAFLTSGGYVVRSMIENCTAYGIDLGMESHNITIIENWMGPNNGQNAVDNGEENFWCDEYAQQGNYWSDYSGEGPYPIPGDAESVDLFPISLDDAPNWEDVLNVTGGPTTSFQTTPIDSPLVDGITLLLASASVVIILLVGISMTRSRVSP